MPHKETENAMIDRKQLHQLIGRQECLETQGDSQLTRQVRIPN